jgi:hypothetical protein
MNCTFTPFFPQEGWIVTDLGGVQCNTLSLYLIKILTVAGIGAIQNESRGGNYAAEKSKLRLIKTHFSKAQARTNFPLATA